MSKKIKLVLSFDITDESFNSKDYEGFEKDMADTSEEMVNDVNDSNMLPGCSNAKFEIIVD